MESTANVLSEYTSKLYYKKRLIPLSILFPFPRVTDSMTLSLAPLLCHRIFVMVYDFYVIFSDNFVYIFSYTVTMHFEEYIDIMDNFIIINYSMYKEFISVYYFCHWATYLQLQV